MGRREGIDQGKKLLGFPNLKFITTDDSIISHAKRLLEKFRINPRDAIHVASALEKKIPEIISDDADLDIIKEIRRIPF